MNIFDDGKKITESYFLHEIALGYWMLIPVIGLLWILMVFHGIFSDIHSVGAGTPLTY